MENGRNFYNQNSGLLGCCKRVSAKALFTLFTLAIGLLVLSTCRSPDSTPLDPIEKGKLIFFNETFGGNGRTCGTCHPAENNFTLDAAFIATLPSNDPLFVAENNPDLAKNFENPKLMRQFGLILENLDGFADLENKFTMRGIPHTLAMPTSVTSDGGPRTGWSGDGAPGDGTLRSFATGAVIQHFTKSLNRIAGVDFRLPTSEELDALEAFMLSLGRQEDLTLPLALKGTVAKRGQELFLDNSVGKCNLCHVNAGATANFGGGNIGNANFNTGVENLPDQPARLIGELIPFDDGLGRAGDSTFNTPPLIEAAETGPFFHNNAIETIEGAVAFYDGETFNNSPAGKLLAANDPNGVGIKLDATQIVEVAAFLRVINALENIRESLELLEKSKGFGFSQGDEARELILQAVIETEQSIKVLEGGRLHPEAVTLLKESKKLAKKASGSFFRRNSLTQKAIDKLTEARAQLIEQV
jgi:hypothetical protein